jgi:hypothetical protein
MQTYCQYNNEYYYNWYHIFCNCSQVKAAGVQKPRFVIFMARILPLEEFSFTEVPDPP